MTPRTRTITVDRTGAPTVKTTIVLPERVWRKAKDRALDERTDFRSVILKALELYLRTPLKRGK
jgi:hypothetical protein